MSTLKIYHNPRCSKSRQTLKLIEDAGRVPHIILYLEDSPSFEALQAIAGRLDRDPGELVRKKEAKEEGMPPGLAGDDLLRFLARHPRVLQRPIVDRGDKAVLGRPPESVYALI